MNDYKQRCCKDKYHDYTKKDVCKNNYCALVRASAFRAVKTAPQLLVANTPAKVLFENEQFDLANEYTPGAGSTFIPKKDGVYSITSTIAFDPATDVNHSVLLGIRVNGNIVAVDNDFFGALPNFTNILTVTVILHLNSGDVLDVIAQVSINGAIVENNPAPPRLNSSHFEAARFPSPK